MLTLFKASYKVNIFVFLKSVQYGKSSTVDWKGTSFLKQMTKTQEDNKIGVIGKIFTSHAACPNLK